MHHQNMAPNEAFQFGPGLLGSGSLGLRMGSCVDEVSGPYWTLHVESAASAVSS